MAENPPNNDGDAKSGRTAPDPVASDRREFVSEAEEILERMFEDLSDLHDQRHSADEVEPDLVNRIFRSAHSLKGLAGMFGLDAIGDLSHHLEDILDGLRLGRISFDSPAIDLLDDGMSLFATMMTSLERGDEPGEIEAQTTASFIEQIDAAVAPPAETAADELDGLGLDPSLLRALTEYEEHRLRENLRRGRQILLVDSTFEMAAFEDGLSELSTAMREVGEVVSTLPSPGAAPESQIRFSLLVASDIDAQRLAARLGDPNVEIQSVQTQNAPTQAPAAAADSAASSTPVPVEGSAPEVAAEVAPEDGARPDENTENVSGGAPWISLGSDDPGHEDGQGGQGKGAKPAVSSAPPVTREIESLRSISETVRVDIRKLDELMNLVGELVIQRNGVADVAQRLSAEAGTARIGADLTKTHKLLDRKIKELQSGVLDVRMVPLQQIFEKLSRVVRRLRRDLGKEVDLDFQGSDTELDKLIVEQLVDPLVHLVRNAFDHALESPEEREAAGKSAAGRIAIRAFQRGNHVVIEVQDDGRGMDSQSILDKAILQGRVSANENLTEREILNLVFEAGLSTCEEVSETSGRGVGMDVVRSNLAEMGGMVDLSSEVGVGTTVTITLPITLAIIQALIVRVGEERYAIPLNSVLETMSVEPDQIGSSEGREVLNLRGEPLLLRRLCEEFELPCQTRDRRQFCVVLGMGAQRLGLLVDALEGQQDTVIKPIKGPLQQIRGITGATELGDRGAILVIDVSAIVGDVLRRREAA
ncbi:MAG: chemotaxis protein CheA [Myxococcota bacterium]